MQIGNHKIFSGNCLEILPEIEKVDLILTDIPYGIVKCEWDSIIPLDLMWSLTIPLLKSKNNSIILFSIQPFTSEIILSNKNMFRYNWIWEKSRPSHFLEGKNQPMRAYEEISVFSEGKCSNGSIIKQNYFPQGVVKNELGSRKVKFAPHSGRKINRQEGKDYESWSNLPRNILKFPSVNDRIHPTQKPVELMEYLIRTYTQEGDTVLDFTMGSGTTIIACERTKRNGIGIEITPEIFETAKDRIQQEVNNNLFKL